MGEIANAFLDVAENAEFRAKQVKAGGVRLAQRASRSQFGGKFLDRESKILKSARRRFFVGRLLRRCSSGSCRAGEPIPSA